MIQRQDVWRISPNVTREMDACPLHPSSILSFIPIPVAHVCNHEAQDEDNAESGVESEHEGTEAEADESDAVFPAFKEDDDDANAAEALGFVASEYDSNVDPDQESGSEP
ncbi:MAG: hypothetical protein BRD25_03910 [Bacteroidetes bacterium QH_1_61_8]|nr:MAG: hypothetical protein BRD25_03910 [Bacteroidetes bacterium QH_1_61_8]